MELNLIPISPNEDKTKAIYASQDCQDLLQMWDEFYPVIGYHYPWVGYFVIENDRVLGTCGFNGKPVDNRVELSYWTFSENEGKGVASRACAALIAIAKQENPEIILTAKTAPEKTASTTILERNGFQFSKIVQDHEIGDAWEWVRKDA